MKHYLSFRYFPRFDFLSAFPAEGEAVTFQVGGDADGGATLLAGAPGCGHGFVDELSDILRRVVVVNAQATELLFDSADLDG